jgi:SAM-dependent methyltransferase
MALEFDQFDTRKYPMLPARDGYREWESTYEQTVLDEMDLDLLARLTTVPWDQVRRAIDLGCGTGRTGVWMKQAGVAEIDGVDITPEMIEHARAKGAHQTLTVGDVSETGMPDASYDLAIASLVDEHLADIAPLYREASRVIDIGGHFVIVGFHPYFIMATGMPTHFHRESGEPVAIETHVHLFSDHFKAASSVGLALIEMDENVIGDRWIEKKPHWEKHRGQLISFAFVWRKDSGQEP